MIGTTKLVCFFGPESTGKTVLARQLAIELNTVCVPEVAREMITSNVFSAEDIVEIGRAQNSRVLSMVDKANRVLLCDTDVITTQIYSQIYLGVVPSELYTLEKEIQYDHYFLFNTDVPWVADGMRDLGQRRSEIFTVFKQALDDRGLPYDIVSGSFEQRTSLVVRRIEELLS